MATTVSHPSPTAQAQAIADLTGYEDATTLRWQQACVQAANTLTALPNGRYVVSFRLASVLLSEWSATAGGRGGGVAGKGWISIVWVCLWKTAFSLDREHQTRATDYPCWLHLAIA